MLEQDNDRHLDLRLSCEAQSVPSLLPCSAEVPERDAICGAVGVVRCDAFRVLTARCEFECFGHVTQCPLRLTVGEFQLGNVAQRDRRTRFVLECPVRCERLKVEVFSPG